MISSLGRLAAVLAVVAALTACGKVATDDSVEEQIKSQLGTDSSDCPTDLQGKEGESIICKATKGGDRREHRRQPTQAGDHLGPACSME